MTTANEAMGDVIQAAETYGDVRVTEAAVPLNQRIADLTIQLQDAITSNSNLQGLLSTANAALAACEAAGLAKDEYIRQLEALLAEATLITQFGFSSPFNTTGLVKPVRGYRTFLSPDHRHSSVAANGGLRSAKEWLANDEDAILWMSIKAFPEAWYESLVRDVLVQFPTQRIFLTSRHEPYDDMYAQGSAGIAEYHRHNDAFEAIVNKIDDPRLEMWTVWEEYRKPSNTPAYYGAMYRPNQRPGFDAYNAGIQTATFYEAPESVFGEVLQWAADHDGRPSAIAETGTGPIPSDTSGAGRRQWAADVKEYLTGKVECALWWNSQKVTLDAVGANAWSGQA